MSARLVCELLAGCAIGLALGALLLYGLVELADWIAEQTYALHQ